MQMSLILRNAGGTILQSNNKRNLRGGKLSRECSENWDDIVVWRSEFTTSGKLREDGEIHFHSVAVQFIKVQGTYSTVEVVEFIYNSFVIRRC